MNPLASIVDDVVSLVYPKVCSACGSILFHQEDYICNRCLLKLPRTNYHKHPENPLNQIFWGRVPLEHVTACFFFQKAGKVQNLLHQLKYQGKREVGIYIGKIYGKELMNSPVYGNVDVITPVPLHKSKMRQRGYNQSEEFAIGLAESMNKPLDTKSLKRIVASETQTRKSRYNRWENVNEIFQVVHSEELAGKHILLTDDVITTGSTIEASARVLLKIPGVKVSVAAIACATG